MRQRLLCILFSILFPALIWGQANNSKPNIILILSDDLGYNDLSSYGSKEIKTPHIDSLARDGVKLLQAYANGFVCTPSRVALMTGRYPQRAGFEYVIMDRDRGLSTKETILARMLKEHGYVTGAFGKWHLGYKAEYGPNAHGFDEFFGFLGSDLDYYAHHDNSGTPGLYDNTQLVNRSGYLTDLITDRAVSFIEKHLKEPFFLYVPYNAPHWPFQPPNRPQDVRDRTTYSPLNGNRADYIRMVEQMDVGVGRILQALEKTGLTKNSLIIFTNDNGGERLSDNRPFFHSKYTLWEGGIHVPCLIKWQRHIPKGTFSNQQLITMDITASILAAAGITSEPSWKLDGQNLLPILTGTQKPQERAFFWRQAAAQGGQKAMRKGDWKYVRDRIELLFNLKDDPAERINLSYRYPEVLLEMRKAVEAWEKDIKDSNGY